MNMRRWPGARRGFGDSQAEGAPSIVAGEFEDRGAAERGDRLTALRRNHQDGRGAGWGDGL
jgi:hypothetical protein